MKSSAVVVAVVLLAGACSTGQGTAPTTTAATVTTTTATTTTTPQTGSCPGDMSAGGALLVRSAAPGDAYRISTLEILKAEGCEQVIVGFATEAGAPATTLGSARVELLPDLGMLRLRLPEIAQTSVTDSLIDSDLLARAYVVRDVDGSLFIDVHLHRPVVAAASVSASPASITVALADAGGEAYPPAPANDSIVVVEPRPGKASYPLRVAGYARTFEANVVAKLLKGGSVDQQLVTTATDYLDTWGSFELVFPSGPQGRTELVVGEDGAELTISLVIN